MLTNKKASYAASRRLARLRDSKSVEEDIKSILKTDADLQRRIVGRRIERRIGTDGPFRLQNALERSQILVHSQNERYQKGHPQRDSCPDDDSLDSVANAVRKSLCTKTLILSWRELKSVPEKIYTTLSSQFNIVHSVKLNGNQISELPNWTKRHFRYLLTLDVSDNLLESLPSCIGKIDSLESLYCNQNKLMKLPDSLCDLCHLNTLELCGNNIGELPSRFGNLISLRTLKLDRNEINLLPGTFPKLLHLRYLDLGMNALQTLAILPNAEAFIKTAVPEEWEIIYDESRGTIYYHIPTDLSQKQNPFLASTEDPWDTYLQGDSEMNRIVPKLDMSSKLDRGTTIKARKQCLSKQGLGVWSCQSDLSSGEMVYYNNVHRKSYGSSIPSELDLFGKLEQLEVLIVRRNMLLEVPLSFTQLKSLRVLNLESNRLCEIPTHITCLVHLTELNMSDNAIQEIPHHISTLTKLRKLILDRNVIEVVSGSIEHLVHLETLWLMQNRIRRLPSTLGKLVKLKDFKLNDNEIYDSRNSQMRECLLEGRISKRVLLNQNVYRPSDRLNSGVSPRAIVGPLPQLSWQMKEQYKMEIYNGPPPESKPVHHGIVLERQETNFSYDNDEELLLRGVETSGVLLLHWRGLTRIPSKVFQLGHVLQELRLVGNSISHLPKEIGLLTNLQVLELRNNKLQEISDCISLITGLKTLLLEDNLLSSLPESIGTLSTLEELSLSGNKLETLPKSIGNLSNLHTLLLNVNRLVRFPSSIGGLKNLHRLHASHNRITEINTELTLIPGLTVLHLNQNQIENIPEGLHRFQSLQELHVGNNRISFIPDLLCQGTLVHTLKSFWLYSNRIIQLCDSFCNFKALEDLRLDFNNMRSPLEEYSSKVTIPQLLEYVSIRQTRIQEIKQLLLEAEFDVTVENIRPKTENLIIGKTGFLTSIMLSRFNEDIDHYVNSDYYNYQEISGRKLVGDLIALRKQQHNMFLKTVVQQFLILMEYLKSDNSICSNYYFNPKIRRKWGANDKWISCYALDLDVLFDAQENPFQPSICDLLDDSKAQHPIKFRNILFQEEHFGLKRDILEEALESFHDPLHGKISSSKERVRFKPFSGGSPNWKEVSVISKVIYTDEEACRCSGEKQLLEKKLVEVDFEVSNWFASGTYSQKLDAELDRRRRQTKRRIAITEVDIQELKKGVKQEAKEVKFAKQRVALYQRGKSFDLHRIETDEEAKQVIQQAESEFNDITESLVKAKALLKYSKAWLKCKKEVHIEECRESIRTKATSRRRKFIIHRGRSFARDQKLRRPWDGSLGLSYLQWVTYIESLEREMKFIMEEAASNKRRTKIDPETNEKESLALELALASVTEKKQEMFKIEEEHFHQFGWSSDETDAVPSEDEFVFDTDEDKCNSDDQDDQNGVFTCSSISDDDEVFEDDDDLGSLSSDDENAFGDDESD